MAAQGLHLSEDGFFAGFACFDRGKPKQTRYRLEAAPGAAGEGPDEQARELTEAAGWRFTARRGDFLIYASDKPGGVELHTDPRVQALSLNLIRKRARRSVFSLIPWLLLGFFLSQRMPLTAWVQIGTPLSLLGAVLVLWAIGSAAGFRPLAAAAVEKAARRAGAGSPQGLAAEGAAIPALVCRLSCACGRVLHQPAAALVAGKRGSLRNAARRLYGSHPLRHDGGSGPRLRLCAGKPERSGRHGGGTPRSPCPGSAASHTARHTAARRQNGAHRRLERRIL